jgi:hypothetical protein
MGERQRTEDGGQVAETRASAAVGDASCTRARALSRKHLRTFGDE